MLADQNAAITPLHGRFDAAEAPYFRVRQAHDIRLFQR